MNHHTSDPVCPLCEDKLGLAHPELQTWFRTHVKPAFPNAHISWSFRDEADQNQAFEDKKSRVKFPGSPHNVVPSKALDLFEINESHEAEFNPAFYSKVHELTEMTGMPIQWGGNFKSFGGDLDHFQLKD